VLLQTDAAAMVEVPAMIPVCNSAAPRLSRSLAVGLAALIAAATALSVPVNADNSAVEPEVGASSTLPGMPPPPAGAPSIPAAAAPTTTGSAAAPQGSQAAAAAPTPPPAAPAAATAGQATPAAGAPASLLVVKWSLGARLQGNPNGGLAAGQPLYLTLTVQGGQAAVDQLHAEGGIPIIVHWTRDNDGTANGAPGLTSELTVGRPGIAPALAGEVEHQGHFEWHTWTRKDTLSPGQWSVSLTYPDGRPVMCGQSAAEPCRFSVNIG
jgi:hypothetical protein